MARGKAGMAVAEAPLGYKGRLWQMADALKAKREALVTDDAHLSRTRRIGQHWVVECRPRELTGHGPGAV